MNCMFLGILFNIVSETKNEDCDPGTESCYKTDQQISIKDRNGCI